MTSKGPFQPKVFYDSMILGRWSRSRSPGCSFVTGAFLRGEKSTFQLLKIA